MSQTTARVILGCSFFLFLGAVLYLGYFSGASWSFFGGCLIGLFAAAAMILHQRRNADLEVDARRDSQSLRWLLLSPLIGVTAVAVFRAIGQRDLHIVVASAAGVLVMLLAGWLAFFFAPPQPTQTHGQLSFRRQVEDKDAKWRRQRQQDDAEWRRRRR